MSALSPAVAKPDHVPQALVYDFDVHGDPALLADPHARILDLVTNAPPVFWSPRNGGGWIVLSHAANYEASRDTDAFSSEFVSPAQFKAMLASLPPGAPHIPLPVPDHARSARNTPNTAHHCRRCFRRRPSPG